jgi:hypothetical protein
LPGFTRGAHAFDNFVPPRFGNGDCLDGLPAGGQFVNDGNVEIRVCGHRERARNGCRRHDELVRMAVFTDTFLSQRHALMHAETMLLIDYNEPELVKADAFLEQCVRADDQWRAAVGYRRERFAARRRLLAAGEPGRFQADRPEPVGEAAPVLFGEQLGRRHDRGLQPARHRLETGNRGNDSLAGTDVALDETHHRVWRLHVAEDLFRDALLCARQPERQLVDECVDLCLSAADRRRGFRVRECPQVLEAEVVGEQLFEGQALLARVAARHHEHDVSVRRWPVQVENRLGQGGHRQFPAYCIGQ